MNRMLALLTTHEWTYETLLKYSHCSFCCSEALNPWYSCNRRSAMVNFHPGLMFIRRQLYHAVKLFVKYTARPSIKMAFGGQDQTHATIQTYHLTEKTVPKPLREKTYIRYGKNQLQNEIIFNFLFSK